MIVNKGDFVPACGLCCTVWRAREVRAMHSGMCVGAGAGAGGSGVLSSVGCHQSGKTPWNGGLEHDLGLGQWPERQMSLVG